MARKLTSTDCLKTPLLPSAYVNFTSDNPGTGDADVEGWTEMEWQIFSALYRNGMAEFALDLPPE